MTPRLTWTTWLVTIVAITTVDAVPSEPPTPHPPSTGYMSTVGVTCQGDDERALLDCAAQPNCSACLTALGTASGTPSPLTWALMGPSTRRATSRTFLQTLTTTEACIALWGTPSSQLILGAAVGAVTLGAPCAVNNAFALSVSPCGPAASACVDDSECAGCLTALLVQGSKVDSLRTPDCNVSGPAATLLRHAASACTLGGCTVAKALCGRTEGCTGCLDTFREGDGARAALQCARGKEDNGDGTAGDMDRVAAE